MKSPIVCMKNKGNGSVYLYLCVNSEAVITLERFDPGASVVLICRMQCVKVSRFSLFSYYKSGDLCKSFKK